MKTYGQFCPVAKAAEVIAERWTPLILRELMMGARRFSGIHGGVPLMSRTMLVQRLNELAAAGIIEARRGDGRGHDYLLTPAGEALRPTIEAMSDWGQRWGQGRIGPKDIDASRLMWAMRAHIDLRQVRPPRFVIRFEFSGIPTARMSRHSWWLAVGPTDIDVCPKNPGYDVDLVVIADLGVFTRTWLGYMGLDETRDKIRFEGTADAVVRAREILKLADQAHQRAFAYRPQVVHAA